MTNDEIQDKYWAQEVREKVADILVFMTKSSLNQMPGDKFAQKVVEMRNALMKTISDIEEKAKQS